MNIIHTVDDLKNLLTKIKSAHSTVGFVPTMGALHNGHISLMEASKQQTDVTVVSIFVNPTQFNNPEDFRRYPIQTENDFELLRNKSCDIVFIPTAQEIYPRGTDRLIHYYLGYLETILEGKYRPGHFQGVCQIVDRLLDIVEPDKLFLGQKDLQQCKVIDRLLEITGRKEKIKLIICPTVREDDGLAMSSRNQRLTASERKTSVAIFDALSEIKKLYGSETFSRIRYKLQNKLDQKGINVEYLELVNTETLEILDDWPVAESMISATACIAAYLDKVRLIDNMILHTVQ